jgi:hypothetical protein
MTNPSLLAHADCTTSCLPARKVWATSSAREAGAIRFPGRWSSVETVGRQWLTAGRLASWRLLDVANAEGNRISGAIVRSTDSAMLEAFLRAAGDHARNRPERTQIG